MVVLSHLPCPRRSAHEGSARTTSTKVAAYRFTQQILIAARLFLTGSLAWFRAASAAAPEITMRIHRPC